MVVKVIPDRLQDIQGCNTAATLNGGCIVCLSFGYCFPKSGACHLSEGAAQTGLLHECEQVWFISIVHGRSNVLLSTAKRWSAASGSVTRQVVTKSDSVMESGKGGIVLGMLDTYNMVVAGWSHSRWKSLRVRK